MRILERRLLLTLISVAGFAACSTPHAPSTERATYARAGAPTDFLDPPPAGSSRSELNRAPATEQPRNVIFITLDGVRYREIFRGIRMPGRADEERGTPVVPDFERIVNERGYFFGNKWDKRDSPMKISNKAALSLPGYRALLTGEFESACRRNTCENIDRPTLIDRLVDEAGLGPTQIATFASWDVMGKAIESKPGRTVRAISMEDAQNIPENEAPFYRDVLERAKQDRPRWHGSRFDKYTFEMGLQYLKSFKPRLLYLSFVDPDEYGHENSYPGYVASLRDFDARFVKLVETLESMGAYGENTSIVVSTDHGRGRGPLFSKHSKEWIDSTYIWAAVVPAPALKGLHGRESRRKYYQSDVRPTIELLLGLAPHSGPNAGKPLIRLNENP